MRKSFRSIGVLMACGVLITLSACSDNKSQEAPSTPNVVEQSTSQSLPASPAVPEQSPVAKADGACGALLAAKCTECHNMTRICEKLGKKSKSRWQRTLTRMSERGAKLNSEEAEAMLTCLDSGVKDLQALCQ